MNSEMIALISIAIAFIAVGISAWQVYLSRKATQAQTFLQMVNTAREIEFSKGMDIIRSLDYNDYSEFRANESPEVQAQVRSVVDFLNDIRHLIKHGYISEEHVLNIYFVSILSCANHLLPWWLDGFRKEHGHPYFYYNFEQLCKLVKALPDDQWLKIEEKYPIEKSSLYKHV